MVEFWSRLGNKNGSRESQAEHHWMWSGGPVNSRGLTMACEWSCQPPGGCWWFPGVTTDLQSTQITSPGEKGFFGGCKAQHYTLLRTFSSSNPILHRLCPQISRIFKVGVGNPSTSSPTVSPGSSGGGEGWLADTIPDEVSRPSSPWGSDRGVRSWQWPTEKVPHKLNW